jgi:hypothetical protein
MADLPSVTTKAGQRNVTLTTASGQFGRRRWLDSCGPASTGQLLAAVERFHSVYLEGVQIRTYAADEPACVGAAEQASWGARDGVTLARGDEAYFATDQYGRSTMP